MTIDDQGLDNAGDSSASAAVLVADSASYTGRLETAETQTGMRLRRKPVMFIESGRLKDLI